jgi:hypothetical protein
MSTLSSLRFPVKEPHPPRSFRACPRTVGTAQPPAGQPKAVALSNVATTAQNSPATGKSQLATGISHPATRDRSPCNRKRRGCHRAVRSPNLENPDYSGGERQIPRRNAESQRCGWGLRRKRSAMARRSVRPPRRRAARHRGQERWRRRRSRLPPGSAGLQHA